ncbi:uncharacterized protein RHOBADRAFT_55971, partial [Rhodotorula graminis WP1]
APRQHAHSRPRRSRCRRPPPLRPRAAKGRGVQAARRWCERRRRRSVGSCCRDSTQAGQARRRQRLPDAARRLARQGPVVLSVLSLSRSSAACCTLSLSL